MRKFRVFKAGVEGVFPVALADHECTGDGAHGVVFAEHSAVGLIGGGGDVEQRAARVCVIGCAI